MKKLKKLITKFLLVVMTLSFLGVPNLTLGAYKPATLINYQTGFKIAVESQYSANHFFSLGYVLDKSLLGFTVVTDYSTTLTTGLSSTAATLPVASVKTKDNVALTMATLGTKVYFNIEPGTAREEVVVCTGVSGSSWTGCTRGLAFSGTSEASVVANRKAHNAGSQVVMSNVHYVYQNFVDLDANQTITGIKNFTNNPTTSTTTPVNANQIVTKSYVDYVTVQGAPNASASVKGISKLSTDPASSTNPIALNSEEVSATSGANKVVRAGAVGKIAGSFIDETFAYPWQGNSFPYGDGTDGDITISVDTTLTRDMYYNNLTINSGKILYPVGFKIFVKGTLTVNGTINFNGANGSNGTASGNVTDGVSTSAGGAAGSGGAKVATSTFTMFTNIAGNNGSAGTNILGGNSFGTNGQNINGFVPTTTGNAGVSGGQGGGASGGSVRTSTGGTLGTTAFVKHLGTTQELITNFYNTIGFMADNGSSGGGLGSTHDSLSVAGTGGGGAGGNGASGGVIFIFARNAVISATGLISANGGTGGNGANSGNVSGATSGSRFCSSGGGGGGGNGGSGGYILIVSYTFSNAGSITVSGGALGTGGTAGTATCTGVSNSVGVNGTNGNIGKTGLINYYNL